MQSFSELLNASIAAYRKNINKVLGLSVFTGIGLLVFQFLVPQHTKVIPPSAFLGIALWAVVYILIATTVTIAIYQLLDGQDKSVADLLEGALHKLGPAIWVGILTGLATVAGFILLIIPGIIVSVWLTFVLQIVALENKSGPAALKVSREYVRGRWWEVFGRLFLLGVVLLGATIVLSILLAIVGAIFGMGIRTFINNVFDIFLLTPIATIFSYYLYRTVAHPTTHE